MTMAGNFGILDSRFLARSLGTLNPQPPMIVAHDEPLSEALKLLQQERCGALVVVNGAEKICGIFTERDIVLKVLPAVTGWEKLPVERYMTAEPKKAHMTTTVAFALNMISLGGYRHIPIVDEEDHPIGLISVKNIVDFLVRNLTSELISFGEEVRV
jgi:CBS domain-containing protein